MRKRKIIVFTLFITQVLLISGIINALNISSDFDENNSSSSGEIILSKQFSKPILKENENYLNINLKETNSYIKKSGSPILPVYTKTYEFPLGTRIKKINFIHSETIDIKILKDIIPAAKPAINYDEKSIIEKNYEIYNKDVFYPENWYSYKTSGGLNRDNKHTTFLTIQINPVRYNPIRHVLQTVESIDLEIIYEKPNECFIENDEYDLLIISYDLYTPFLKPLVEHKNSHDVDTKLVSLRNIYNNNSLQGRDEAEKIKFYIKDAVEKWGVTYVMLVGNFRKFPVRKTHLETDKGGPYEELEFASDLYFADLYDSEGNFSSWDTDGDEIYGEWPYPTSMVDDVDLTPDVYVGRLACMYYFEVKTMVDKIIEYENNANNSDWFNTMIVCGGDTFDKSWEGGTDYDEGEVTNEKALEYMPEFKPVKLYASLGNLTTQNIKDEISKGAGFLYFVGHGNPRHWSTHVNGDYKNWTEGISNRDMLKLTNLGEYPILMVGGCHNSEFCTTPLNFINGLLTEGIGYILYSEDGFGSYYLYNWVPECWSWVFVKKF